jgi:2Fe-2S ferredoxin
MAKIIFRTRDGEIETSARSGDSLLAVANKAGVKLFGGCAGAGVCGTCHVVIDQSFAPKLGEVSSSELDVLEILPHRQDGSRLACQVVVTDDLDEMVVVIP